MAKDTDLGINQYNKILEDKVDFLSSIVNSLSDWILILNKEYHIVEVHGDQEAGFPLPEDLEGKSLMQIISSPDAERFKEKIDAAFEARTGKLEWIFTFRNHRFNFHSTFSPIDSGQAIDNVLIISRDISAIKQTQNEVENQRIFLDTIINHTPFAIFAKDHSNRFIMVNDYYCRLMQKEREEMIGKDIAFFKDKEQINRLMDNEKQVLTKGVPARYESWIDDHNNRQLLYDVIKVPLKNREGDIIGLVGIGRNITKLRDIEQRLQLAIEIAKEYIVEWDFSRNRIVFSADFYQSLDYEPGFFDGGFIRAFKGLTFKVDRKEIIDWTREQYLASKSLTEYEVRLKDNEGTSRWFIIRGQVVSTNINNQPRKAVYILIDISNIKAMQLKLKEHNHQLNQLISSVPGVVFTYDNKKNRLSFISTKCKEIFGFSVFKMLRDPSLFRSLILDEYVDIVENEIARSFRQEKDYDIKYKARNSAGKILWVWERGNFRIGSQGKRTNIFDGIIMDITESMQVEERISSATIQAEEKERKRLAQEIHDSVQQILISSLFHFRSVEEKIQQLGDDAALKYQQGIKHINDAIHEARLVSHNLVPSTIYDYGLNETINALIQDISTTGRLTIEFQTNIRNRRFDERLELNVYRILQESINNVMKYAKSPGLLIQLNCIKEKILINIIDEGVGFDTEEINFDNSFGLSSMRSRTKALDGNITIESMKGVGTKITIEIPLV